MATTISSGIKLDATTRERLSELGHKRDRSPHYLMKLAIERFLNQEEAYEREKQEDLQRYEHYLLTGEAVSHDKAIAWMESLASGKAKPCPH